MESTCICENSFNSSRYEFVYEWWCKHQMFFKVQHNSDADSYVNEEWKEEEFGQDEAMLEREQPLPYWYGGCEYGVAFAQFDETPLPWCYGADQYDEAIDPYGATPLPFYCAPMMEYQEQTLLDHDGVASQYDPAPPPYYEPPRAYSI